MRLKETSIELLPREPSGRTRSKTNPIVFANRTGLWGVFAICKVQSKSSSNEKKDLTYVEAKTFPLP